METTFSTSRPSTRTLGEPRKRSSSAATDIKDLDELDLQVDVEIVGNPPQELACSLVVRAAGEEEDLAARHLPAHIRIL
jgi:hypothetical protein